MDSTSQCLLPGESLSHMEQRVSGGNNRITLKIKGQGQMSQTYNRFTYSYKVTSNF